MDKVPMTAKIKIEYDCQRCGGRGYEETKPYCWECNRKFENAELDNAGDSLPCGHSWSHLSSTYACQDCEGETGFVREITLQELADIILLHHSRINSV